MTKASFLEFFLEHALIGGVKIIWPNIITEPEAGILNMISWPQKANIVIFLKNEDEELEDYTVETR